MTDDVQTVDLGPVTVGDAPRPDAALAPRSAGSGLAIRPDQAEWSPVQRAALTQVGLQDAPDADVAVFFHVCQRTRLDPFAKQIYMIGRWDNELGRKRWTIQTGIDGFRVVSERHEQYAGVGDPDLEWCGPDGVWRDVWLDDTTPPTAARFTLHRHDQQRPIRAVCRYAEFVETRRDGTPNHMWRTKAAWMIGKCAEAAGRRKAFPQDLAGLYTDDEMAGVLRDNEPVRVADNGRTVIHVSEPAAAPDAPDWDARIAEYVEARDAGALNRLAALARGARAGDDVLERIAGALDQLAAPTAEPTGEGPGRRPSDRLAGEPQRKRMVLLIGEGGVTDDDQRRTVQSAMAGRELASSKQLTNREAAAIIDQLQAWKREGRLGLEVTARLPRPADVDPLPNPSRPLEWHERSHPVRDDTGNVTYSDGPEEDCAVCTDRQ